MQVHKTDASTSYIYLVRELFSKKHYSVLLLSVPEFVIRTNTIFEKFVISFKKEPCESRILVPDKNIAHRETFIIVRFPDVYDVDS